MIELFTKNTLPKYTFVSLQYNGGFTKMLNK